jgi:cytochrome P450
MVVLYLAGANRDPDAYDDPNRFDLTRTGRAEHLAFSAGIHYYLGAPRARLEATVVLQRLVQRFPRLQRAGRAEAMQRQRDTRARGARGGASQPPSAGCARTRLAGRDP